MNDGSERYLAQNDGDLVNLIQRVPCALMNLLDGVCIRGLRQAENDARGVGHPITNGPLRHRVRKR